MAATVSVGVCGGEKYPFLFFQILIGMYTGIYTEIFTWRYLCGGRSRTADQRYFDCPDLPVQHAEPALLFLAFPLLFDFGFDC